MIVIARAAAVDDSYRAIAWGTRLTVWADPQTAIAALTANEVPFSERERALADRARAIELIPRRTTGWDIPLGQFWAPQSC